MDVPHGLDLSSLMGVVCLGVGTLVVEVIQLFYCKDKGTPYFLSTNMCLLSWRCKKQERVIDFGNWGSENNNLDWTEG